MDQWRARKENIVGPDGPKGRKSLSNEVPVILRCKFAEVVRLIVREESVEGGPDFVGRGHRNALKIGRGVIGGV
jgi:hypothetical protein